MDTPQSQPKSKKNNSKSSDKFVYDWDEYFMSVACLAALRSKDSSTAVRYCHYYTVK